VHSSQSTPACGEAQILRRICVHQIARNLKQLLCSEPGHQDQRVDMWCAVCEIMICVQVCFPPSAPFPCGTRLLVIAVYVRLQYT